MSFIESVKHHNSQQMLYGKATLGKPILKQRVSHLRHRHHKNAGIRSHAYHEKTPNFNYNVFTSKPFCQYAAIRNSLQIFEAPTPSKPHKFGAVKRGHIGEVAVVTRSTTTSDRNLQFLGSFSTGCFARLHVSRSALSHNHLAGLKCECKAPHFLKMTTLKDLLMGLLLMGCLPEDLQEEKRPTKAFRATAHSGRKRLKEEKGPLLRLMGIFWGILPRWKTTPQKRPMKRSLCLCAKCGECPELSGHHSLFSVHGRMVH